MKNNHKAQLLLELGSCIFSQSWPLWRCESALGPLASACPLTIRGLHFGLPQKLWGFHSASGFHLRGDRRHFEEIMTSWPEDNTVVAAVFFPLLLLFFSLCLFVYFWLEQVSWHFSLCWENSLFARSKEEGRKQVSDRSEGMFVCVSLSGGTGQCWQPLNIYCRGWHPLVILLTREGGGIEIPGSTKLQVSSV